MHCSLFIAAGYFTQSTVVMSNSTVVDHVCADIGAFLSENTAWEISYSGFFNNSCYSGDSGVFELHQGVNFHRWFYIQDSIFTGNSVKTLLNSCSDELGRRWKRRLHSFR